jgi:flagellin
MNINTNMPNLSAQFYFNLYNKKNQSVMERLASGKRINKASDDAAGLSIANKMNSYIKSMSMAETNIQNGQSMLQTADSAQSQITDILYRIRDLAIQADNGVYSVADKTALQNEYNDLKAEVDRIANNTTYNDVNIANANTSVTLHVSEKATDTMTINFQDVRSATLGIGALDLTTNPSGAITAVDAALNTVSANRANLGAKMNRLDFSSQNLQSSKTNLEASLSRIQDADLAKEMSENAKYQILMQSSMQMIGQSNNNLASILTLLQR